MKINPRKILIISFILIFFISISAISATDVSNLEVNIDESSDGGVLSLEDDVELSSGELDVNLPNEKDVLSLEDDVELSSGESDVDFSSNITNGKDSISVQFNGTSDKENINCWNWDFGDGETGEGQNISHTYSKIGLYNVTLSITNNDGTYNVTKNNYISVYHLGEVFSNPSFDEGKTGYDENSYTSVSNYNVPGWVVYVDKYDIMYYTGESFGGQNRVLTLCGSSDDLKHIYQIIDLTSVDSISFKYYRSAMNTKNFLISINCTQIYSNSISRNTWAIFTVDVSGYSGICRFEITPDKFTQQNLYFDDFTASYNDKLTSNFEYIATLDGESISVQFTNKATGLINNIFWDFGDGTNSSDINPTRTFAPGNYKVTLTVSNENNTANYTYNLNLNYPTIDGKMYATVQDAINDAESGAVIDIPSDFSENLIVNQTVTLNFNGNKLTSSNSPLISVVNGADVTVNNISLSGDSNVFAVDETSKLTIKDSTISDAKLELQSGNITLNDVALNNAQLTINANATLTNVNTVNSGVIIVGGKSKITKSAFTASDVAIAQTGGELELTNNIIKDNNVALNITTESATISLNAIYNNTSLNINESATVTNNWFGTNQVTGFDSYLRLVITAPVSEMYPGKEYTITAELVPNTGSLEGSIDNLTLEFTTSNGETTPVTINNNNGEFKFTAGQITDEVTLKLFNEDYTLVNGENPVSIVTEPLDTNITITSPENGVVVIRLSTAEGNVSGANVSYTINGGNKVNNVTDTNGQIIIKDLTGKVTINATYDGNKTLNPSVAIKAFDFTIATVITAANVSTTYGAAKELIITLTANDNALANKTIGVVVGTINKNLTTNASGQVSVDVSTLAPDTYVANIAFAGDDTYIKSNATANVVVNKVATSLTAPAVSATYNVAKNLVITLTANGKPLNGQKVTVKVGTISKTLTTDAKGQVSVAISSLVPKTYTATISFAGDKIYTASSTNAKVVVAKAKSVITAKKKTFKAKKKIKKYTITLKANKKAISKVKVTLKVKGKTYKAKTNAKGKATFKINKLTKKGKHTATIKFAGNKYYKASTKKVKITVK